jgi:hypothetical protein
MLEKPAWIQTGRTRRSKGLNPYKSKTPFIRSTTLFDTEVELPPAGLRGSSIKKANKIIGVHDGNESCR